MSRVPPVAPSTILELAPVLEQAERAMGYLPNHVLSLCHWPELLQSLGGLVHTVLQTGEVHPTLKRLIGVISSRTQGCTYCTAHSSYGANQLGVDAEKIAARDAYVSSNIVSIFIMSWGMQLSIRCRGRFLVKKKMRRMFYPF